jgi:hypothetical protein
MCPLRGRARQGQKNLVDALSLFVTTCFEMGSLDEVMKVPTGLMSSLESTAP